MTCCQKIEEQTEALGKNEETSSIFKKQYLTQNEDIEQNCEKLILTYISF